ncbi:uncharacterized protein EV422DRAFT_547063 [Fimicolochytrium jonesii]|uniref:uncharacterized protein n=1 Tax=Fimicolochytrium jonesii TaxID=1396493 RepID=UPI0022FE3B47|nr:uncharacterized protein EV422DRAFT_547063 [Fimicolochytrium jonesii]KAI8816188.1 hypothetical protein EV422DRAFT_547063 [Fimicolochytrium jonesii]
MSFPTVQTPTAFPTFPGTAVPSPPPPFTATPPWPDPDVDEADNPMLACPVYPLALHNSYLYERPGYAYAMPAVRNLKRKAGEGEGVEMDSGNGWKGNGVVGREADFGQHQHFKRVRVEAMEGQPVVEERLLSRSAEDTFATHPPADFPQPDIAQHRIQQHHIPPHHAPQQNHIPYQNPLSSIRISTRSPHQPNPHSQSTPDDIDPHLQHPNPYADMNAYLYNLHETRRRADLEAGPSFGATHTHHQQQYSPPTEIGGTGDTYEGINEMLRALHFARRGVEG